ncbi:MAG: hypothetical protein LBI45_09200 [Bacteroidales bacterium]|jgi:hypothetical protein|nr:hypothetical protein [Bacteroidales bacterium]
MKKLIRSKKKKKSLTLSYLFVFIFFAFCKLNGHAQLIQNVNLEETAILPFILQDNRIYFQIQVFDEKFNIFLDNGAPKTIFPITIIEKFFTLLPDSLICQIFPKIPETKDYEKRVILNIGNYDLTLDTIRVDKCEKFTLGAELFERRIVNFDFANETLIISSSLPIDIDSYISIEMSSKKLENRFGVEHHYFLIQIPDFKNIFNLNVPLFFFVDLGTRLSLVSDKTIRKVDYKKFINDPTFISSLFSTVMMYNRPNLRLSYPDGSEIPQDEMFDYFDGIIGIDVLKRFHNVIFDYQGKKFYVKTNK